MESVVSPIPDGTSNQTLQNFVAAEPVNSTMTPRKGIRRVYLAAFCCLLQAVAMGIAVGYSASATYDMKSRPYSPIKPSESEITWIGSMLAFGAMVGGVCAGPISDWKGRKIILIVNLVPFAIGWLTIFFAKVVPVVMIGRFCCGMACGVISVTVPMYCVEISSADIRGKLGSAFQLFMMIGNLFSVILGLYVTWEYLALIGAICSLIAVASFFPMPETPRWLLAKGKLEDAIQVMENLHNGSVNAEEECKAIYKDIEEQPKGLLSCSECKHPTIYKPAFIAFLLMFFQQFSGINVVLFYSSDIFTVSKDLMDPKVSTIILGFVQVIATVFSNLVVDKAGRKLLLSLSGNLMALSLTYLGVYYYVLVGNPSIQIKYNWVPFATLLFFVISFSIGFGPVPWLLANEMVHVRARSTVSGLATFSNGLFAFMVTKTFSDFKDGLGSYGVFWFYGALCISAVVFVTLIVPETKGKKLEDIENVFQRPKPSISISVISGLGSDL